MPRHEVLAESHELDHLWPGHQVTAVNLEFSLNEDREPDLEDIEVTDAAGLVLSYSKLIPAVLQWASQLFDNATDSLWEQWWDQQCEVWATVEEERGFRD